MSNANDRSGAGVGPPASPGRLVGRERELDGLLELLDGKTRGRRAVLISGEAGVGKTHLLTEFVGHARGKGLRVLEGHCYPVEEAGPYFPFLQILAQLGHRKPKMSDFGLEARPRRRSRTGPEALADDAPARRARFVRGVSQAILKDAPEKDTVLTVDDLQWADVESLLVLNDLLDLQQDKLCVVCTVRPDEPVGAGARQLLARVEGKAHRTALRGLGVEPARELLREIAGPGYLTDAELDALRSLTNGNPLLLSELVRHLLETGLLSRHRVLTAVEACEVPDRLAYAIDLRLGSVPRRVLRVLRAGAVAGEDFNLALVAAALEAPEEAIEDAVDVAARRGILRRLHGVGDLRYRFSHALFRARAYESLKPSQRRRLHRRLADAAAAGRFDLGLEELARHYALGTGAGEGSAVSFCEAAAEQAEQVFAYEKAARLWGLAVTCSRRLPVEQRAGLWSRLGRALWAAREWTGAVEAWEQAVRLLERLDDRPGLAKHSLALADTYRWRNELADSERWVKRALDLGLEDRAERARALSILGHIHCSRDQSDLGLSLLEEARDEVAAEGGDPFVSYWLSYGYLTSGDPDRAYAAARQGLAEASGQGHAGAVVLLAGSLIQQELCRLRPDAAREYSKVLDDAVLPTDTPGLNRSYLCKALVLGYGGRWKQVIGLCDRWMAEMRLAGRFQVAIARLVRAEASAALGNAELAQAELLRILADLSEMRPLGALHLARVLVRQGKKEEASLLIRQYVDRVTAGSRHSSPRAFLSEVAASLGKRDLCEQYYRLLSQETRPVLAVYAPISVQRVLGKLATALKDWPAAVQHFDNAVDQLTKGKAPWELAQTYLDYAAMWRARRRRGDSTRAASLEIEAERIFEGLGVGLPRGSAARPTGNRFGLTGRELEVLGVLAEGRSNPEIAEALTITRGTVERHLERIFAKMAVNGRTEAVVRAIEEGLVGPLVAATEAEPGQLEDRDFPAAAV